MAAGASFQLPQSAGGMSPPVVVGLVAVFVLAAALALCWWAYRRDTYRRTALRDLDDLVPQFYDEETRKQALAKLAILLKRTALLVYPRERVAPLSGAAWLVFLAETAAEPDFTRRPGQMFVATVFNPKASPLPSREECDQIARLARRWITQHRSPLSRGRGAGAALRAD